MLLQKEPNIKIINTFKYLIKIFIALLHLSHTLTTMTCTCGVVRGELWTNSFAAGGGWGVSGGGDWRKPSKPRGRRRVEPLHPPFPPPPPNQVRKAQGLIIFFVSTLKKFPVTIICGIRLCKFNFLQSPLKHFLQSPERRKVGRPTRPICPGIFCC